MGENLEAIRQGIHLVVATPGRLNDMLNKKRRASTPNPKPRPQAHPVPLDRPLHPRSNLSPALPPARAGSPSTYASTCASMRPTA